MRPAEAAAAGGAAACVYSFITEEIDRQRKREGKN